MTKKIVYKEGSHIVVVNPAPGFEVSDIIGTVVPDGITGFIVDAADLPDGPISQWTLDDQGVLGIAPYVVSDADVDRERDRRMYGGFVFNGTLYQTDAGSISNILGASQLAFMAIVGGASQGDLHWAGSTPFTWIAADNSKITMDAYTVVGFAKAAAAFRSGIIYMARAAKDRLAAGETFDVTADSVWNASETAQQAPSGPTGPSGGGDAPTPASSAPTGSES